LSYRWDEGISKEARSLIAQKFGADADPGETVSPVSCYPDPAAEKFTDKANATFKEAAVLPQNA
jgi:hypothetical protein